MSLLQGNLEHLCLYGGVNIENYETYQQFLDSRMMQQDVDYISDVSMIRKLIELGYRTDKEELSEAEFYRRKTEIARLRRIKRLGLKYVISYNMNFANDPLLANLKLREGPNKTGEIHSVVFVMCLDTKGIEVSGYIDLAHRLVTDNFEKIFKKQKLLIPKHSDLSHCNHKFLSTRNTDSPNWKVVASLTRGLTFVNKVDKKTLYVDGDQSCGELTSKVTVEDQNYRRLLIFDHHVHK